MIAGHFGLAAMVKSRERTAPLWALMLATVWLDIVFVPLLLLNIESLQPLGEHAGYGAVIIHADYTHSIVGMIVLSAALGAAFLRAWGRRVALVVGLVSASHWALDLLVHRADMPILPADWLHWPRLGLGLWRYPWVSAAVELLLVVAGAALYWRAARAVSLQSSRSTRWASISSALILIFGVLVLFLDVRA